jgi:hypothetical protein
VRSTLSIKDLPATIKKTLSSANGRARLVLEVDRHRFEVDGRGAKGLTFSNPQDLVIRKSDFISDRTLMICSTKAAVDIPRNLVRLLKNPAKRISFNLSTRTEPV